MNIDDNDYDNEELTVDESSDDVNQAKKKAQNNRKKVTRRYKAKKNKTISKQQDGGAKKVIEKIQNRDNLNTNSKQNSRSTKTEKAGKVADNAGQGMQGAGQGMQVAGQGLQKGGEAIAQGSKALGEAISATGVGAPIGAAIAGTGTVVGKGAQAAGKGTEKAGSATEQAGKKVSEAGKRAKQSGKRAKQSGKRGKKGAIEKKKKEFIKKFILTHIPQCIIAVLIIIAVLFLIGLVMFFVNMPGLVLGSIDEFGRNLIGNLQGMLTGDSTTAKISSTEIVDLAQHLQAMGYDIQGYGLGSVEYEKDGSTSSSRNGKAKEIKAINESVDGKQYLRSYIATNENTYVLSEWSIGGFFKSIGNNIVKAVDDIIDITPDNLKATSSEDFSTGMINIVGQTDSSIFESSNASDYVSIDRNTKQMKIYSDAFKLPDFGWLGDTVGIGKRLLTGDNKIQFGETFSYDLNNWVGRYGRPTELFLALHLSTLMPDLTYEIATNQDFNTKVNMGMMDATVQFAPTATKGDSTIDSLQIMRYFLQYCVGRNDIEGLSDEELKTEFRKTTEDIIAMTIANITASDKKIPGTEWTTAEIAELAAITHTGMNKSSSNTSSSSTNPSFSAVGEDNGNFKKYNLNDHQLSQMTFVAYREQGSDAGAAAEASLMANLFELRRNGEGGADGLVDYVLHGGWFAAASTGSTDDDPAHKEIVKQVLVNGKRTLPAYIDEHDCFSDIPSATNNGTPINVSDRSAYIKDTTIINNCYGSTYTFYSFPEENSDPFGYHEKFGNDFHYEFNSSSDSSSSSTGSSTSSGTSANTSDGLRFVTGVNITRDEYIKKCEAYQPPREFAQYAGTIYDVCIKNKINPVLCASHGWIEQNWNSPDSAKYNFWGLGIYNGMNSSVLGPVGSVEEYTQKYCDNINQRLRGELGVIETSQELMPYDSHYTGGVNTIYDVFDNYGAPDGDQSPPAQAAFMVDYIDNYLFKVAKDIFGEDIVNVDSYQSGNGINIKWPFIASVTNHWYYNDIDFTKGVYRFAKAATKTMDYIPEDENNILNKNNVSVKLDSKISSDMGVIYQVAEPEAIGPNEKIIKLFNDEYYKYDGSIDRAKKVEMKKAQDINKSTFNFNGETYTVSKEDTKDIEKQKVSFKENKPEALAAFGILDNMHTEASDYIYRNLKELMVSLKHFTTAELTEDLENILLWPIKTENKDKNWETTLNQNKFGTTIKCGVEEDIVIAPIDAVVKEVNGNSITLKVKTLNKDATELLEYIYKYKDKFKKINRELLTGYEITIDDIELDGEIKKGTKIKRGQNLGKAIGKTDEEKSITITMYQLDKSVVEDISTYLRQEENTKYEEIMKTKKEAILEYREGLDITQLIYGGTGGNSSSVGWSGDWKQYYQSDYPGYPWGGGEIPGWGCGPTSFAMVATHIAGKDIDPPAATQWCGPSAYTVSSGTTYDYFPAAAKHFNLNCDVIETGDTNEALEALKKGYPVISSQSAGLFTAGGHYIVLADIDSSNKIRVLDPNKSNAIDKGYNDRRFTADEISEANLGYFIFKKR